MRGIKEGHTLRPEECAHCEKIWRKLCICVSWIHFPRHQRARSKPILREEGITLETWDTEAAGYKLKR